MEIFYIDLIANKEFNQQKVLRAKAWEHFSPPQISRFVQCPENSQLSRKGSDLVKVQTTIISF